MRFFKVIGAALFLLICFVYVNSVFAQPYSPTNFYPEAPASVPGGAVSTQYQFFIPEHILINRIRVRLNITVSNTSDLTIGLTHGANYTDLFLNRGVGSNLNNTVFDDQSGIPIALGSPPFTGDFLPDQQVSQDDFQPFAGDSTDGAAWVLSIFDVGVSAGQLNEWSLEINNIELPVEMTSFSATAGENKVVLRWHTETETNNSFFNLYRSAVASDLGSRVAQVAGNGSTSTPHDYVFTDTRVSNGLHYFYRISDVDANGIERFHSMIVSATPRQNPTSLPEHPTLSQNYPNPFNPTTEITYNVRNSGSVRLSVYNALGRSVATLVNGYQTANTYSVKFNASQLPSGTYFYTLNAKGETERKQMILIK